MSETFSSMCANSVAPAIVLLAIVSVDISNQSFLSSPITPASAQFSFGTS
jgi:hypothetical protein